MNDYENMTSGLGRSSWLELAGGGGVLLRDVAEALGNRPAPRAPRARRGLLALTSDASDSLPSPTAD